MLSPNLLFFLFLFLNQAAAELLTLKGPQGSKKGRPCVENGIPGLHHEILSIILPESAAEERGRSELYNTVRSLNDLKVELDNRGYHLKRTTLYYRYVFLIVFLETRNNWDVEDFHFLCQGFK